LPIGKGEVVREGKDLFLLAYGSMVPVALEAARMLSEMRVDCGIANLRYAKPLDLELLAHARKQAPRLLTLEEHLVMGGVGSAVLEAFRAQGWDAATLRVPGTPDVFGEPTPAPLQRANFKPDPAGVVETALAFSPDMARGAAPAKATAGGSRRDNL